jgi:hypothetical protein
MIKVTCLSDLHGDRPVLGGGDLLIVAGDCTAMDKVSQWQQFGFWLNAQKYQHKVWIAGNHDEVIEANIGYAREFCAGATYLQDSGIEIGFDVEVEEDHKFRGTIQYTVNKKLKIWGTPWTNYFEGVNPDCDAFMLRSEFQLQDKYELIPEDTDILVTHGPCFGRLDETLYGDRPGSTALRSRVDFLRTKRLRYHVHGHIHEAYGMHEEGGLTTLNVSRMNRDYRPVNKIVNFEIKV